VGFPNPFEFGTDFLTLSSNMCITPWEIICTSKRFVNKNPVLSCQKMCFLFSCFYRRKQRRKKYDRVQAYFSSHTKANSEVYVLGLFYDFHAIKYSL